MGGSHKRPSLWLCIHLCFLLQITFTDKLETSLAPNNTTVSFHKLHKCLCSANEMWFQDVCYENNTIIKVMIETSDIQVIETKAIHVIKISEIHCPPHHLNLTLPGDSFVLKPSGKLFNINYGLSFEFNKYCVEHFHNNDQNRVEIEAHVCLPVPAVPICCPDGECQDNNTSQVVVPFLLGRNLINAKTDTFANLLNCSDNRDRVTISTSPLSGNTNLRLVEEGLVLTHQVNVFGGKVYIPSPQFCLQFDPETKTASAASFCYEEPFDRHVKSCQTDACIRKCCPLDQIYDMVNFKCETADRDMRWNPKLLESNETDQTVNESIDLKMVFGFPINCEFYTLSSSNEPADYFRLLPDGTLYVDNWDQALPSHQYCIDNFDYGNTAFEEALVCFMEHSDEYSNCRQVKNILYPILVIISCIFLVLTLVVYAMIPDLNAKVQGKCLIASISALIAAYVSMVVVQLTSQTLTQGGCVAIGLLLQFSTLASFFWLNVMSFDIWRALRSMRIGRGSAYSERRRYLFYSLYAWGCPLAIMVVTAIMQFVPKPEDGTNAIRPRIGETDCFFPSTDNRALWVYFYGFISFTLMVNSFIFVHLAIVLLRAKQVSEAALGKNNQFQKEWAKLYLKLFLIMGITWIFEVASWVEGTCAIWVVTDIINSLRGVLIFIIFVCKKDVIKKLLSESSPAFHRMRQSMRQSIFSKSSKRTSTFFVDPSTTCGGSQDLMNAEKQNGNQTFADAKV